MDARKARAAREARGRGSLAREEGDPAPQPGSSACSVSAGRPASEQLVQGPGLRGGATAAKAGLPPRPSPARPAQLCQASRSPGGRVTVRRQTLTDYGVP